MATAKKNTSLVKNTARQVTLKGNAAKSSTAKRNVARPKTSRNAKPVQSRRRPLRRNSAATATAGLLAAFAGAMVINGFDMLINRFAPNTSGMLRTIGKFGAGFLVGMYGEKLPLIKGFAPTIRNALYLAGALDVVGTYIMPKLTDLLSSGVSSITNAISPAATVVATAPTTDKATGELGRAYTLSNGQTFEVYGSGNRPAFQGGFAW